MWAMPKKQLSAKSCLACHQSWTKNYGECLTSNKKALITLSEYLLHLNCKLILVFVSILSRLLKINGSIVVNKDAPFTVATTAQQ